MYDNLETLGDTPDKVEESLRALGFETVRLSRSKAREMLNDALDSTSANSAEREVFISAVLSNNCVISGEFHHCIDGVVLGCPLTLGLNLPTYTDNAAWKEEYPGWASSFYGRWDDLCDELARKVYDIYDIYPETFVFEGE
jgi:hypothetical protein